MGGVNLKVSAHSPAMDDPKAGCRGLSCLQSLGQPNEPACEVVVEKSPSPWNVIVEGSPTSVEGVNKNSAGVAVPSVLTVTSPNGQQDYEGTYQIVANLMPNGLPIWRKRGDGRQSDKWLYSSVHGTWNFGSDKARRHNFNCHSACIFCLLRHGGIMPHKMATWWRAEENNFTEDPSISVTEAPASADWFADDSSGEEEALAMSPTCSSTSLSSSMKRDLNDAKKEDASRMKTGTNKNTLTRPPSSANETPTQTMASSKSISVRLLQRSARPAQKSRSDKKMNETVSGERALGQ